jgi:ABC-type glutathione transport system ATPase component
MVLTIKETRNDLPNANPVKEIMKVFIEQINVNLPRRNGFIWAIIGSGGSGKSSLLLSMFRSSRFYRSKFDTLYLITPFSSYASVEKHPFAEHDKVYHELTATVLNDIYTELIELKEQNIADGHPQESCCCIIDDYASDLKNNDILKALNTLLIKARHLNCCFIFTVQAYNLTPMVIRKQLTNATIFKPKNQKEFESISSELLNMNKDDSLQLFNYCFDKPYNHLDVDTVISEYRKNFNTLNIDNGTTFGL